MSSINGITTFGEKSSRYRFLAAMPIRFRNSLLRANDNIETVDEGPAFLRMGVNAVVTIMAGDTECINTRRDVVPLGTIARQVHEDVRLLPASKCQRFDQFQRSLELFDPGRETESDLV